MSAKVDIEKWLPLIKEDRIEIDSQNAIIPDELFAGKTFGEMNKIWEAMHPDLELTGFLSLDNHKFMLISYRKKHELPNRTATRDFITSE